LQIVLTHKEDSITQVYENDKAATNEYYSLFNLAELPYLISFMPRSIDGEQGSEKLLHLFSIDTELSGLLRTLSLPQPVSIAPMRAGRPGLQSGVEASLHAPAAAAWPCAEGEEGLPVLYSPP